MWCFETAQPCFRRYTPSAEPSGSQGQGFIPNWLCLLAGCLTRLGGSSTASLPKSSVSACSKCFFLASSPPQKKIINWVMSLIFCARFLTKNSQSGFFVGVFFFRISITVIGNQEVPKSNIYLLFGVCGL